MSDPQCAACRAPIRWIETMNGSRMPANLQHWTVMAKTPEVGIYKAVSGLMSHHATCPCVWEFNHHMGVEWHDANKQQPSNGEYCIVRVEDGTFSPAWQRAGSWLAGMKVEAWALWDDKWFNRIIRADQAAHVDQQILDRMRIWYKHHFKGLRHLGTAHVELSGILGVSPDTGEAFEPVITEAG